MQKKIKVLYLDIPLDPPGGGQFSLHLILDNIDREKFEPFVFLSNTGSFFEILKSSVFNVKVVPVFFLFFEIIKFKPDLIHCNSATTKYSFIGALAASVLKIPFIWHSRVVETAGWKDKVIVKLSTKIIAISRAVKDKFIRTKDKDKIIIIFNAVNIEKFKPDLNIDYLYKELNLKKEHKIIGIFSRLDWRKGHKLLLNAFKILCDKYQQNTILLIVGEGSEKNHIDDIILKENLKDKVTFTDFRKDIPYLMNICDVIVNPSTEPEAFGRTVIEAMSCQKAVIATSMGGHLDIIENKVDGFLVEPDPNTLADQLFTLLNNDVLRKTIAVNARKKVLSIFSIKTQTELISALYMDLVTKS